MSSHGAGAGSQHSFADTKAQILAATDIVQLIGRSVSLKRVGAKFLGLCPFHQEKTPSFNVNPSEQFFYCFGCKKHGNAIDFVIERDRIEFKEALRLLAREAGIELPDFSGSREKSSQRQVLYDAHSIAAQYFVKNLNDPRIGKPAREYLEKRGFNAETIQKFQIGVALDSWDGLATSPLMRKFPPGELAAAGLLKPRNTGPGHYDTFRNRLMFPIRDEGGRIIAFGGRIMPGSEDPAKYLNSPESPLFSKGRCIYGLDMARPHIVSGAVRTAIIVEGYTDVVMAHQFSVGNVVSVLGTALTESHVNVLRRFADRIVLLFDGDAAGDSAADRALELFLTQPIEIAIASLPPGVDPDEMLLKFGVEGFSKVIDTAEDALSYKWRCLQRQYEATSDLTGRQKAIEQYLQTLAAAKGSGPIDAIRWGQAIARVSRLTEIPANELHARFKGVPGRSKGNRAGNVRYNHPGATGGGQSVKENEAIWSKSTSPANELSTVRSARERAEDQILGLLLADASQWMAIQAQIGPDDFSSEVRRTLAEIYWDHQRHEGEPVFSQFLSLLDGPQRELAIELSQESEATPQTPEAIAGSIQYLIHQRVRGEQRKHLASLHRMSDAAPIDDDAANAAAQLASESAESTSEASENRQISPAAPLTPETARLPYATAKSEAGGNESPNDDGKGPKSQSALEALKLQFERARQPDLRRVGS